VNSFDPLKRQDRGGLPAKEEGGYEGVAQPLGEDESDTGAGRVVPVKGSAECFSRSGCARKTYRLEHPIHESFTSDAEAFCQFGGWVPFVSDACQAESNVTYVKGHGG